MIIADPLIANNGDLLCTIMVIGAVIIAIIYAIRGDL